MRQAWKWTVVLWILTAAVSPLAWAENGQDADCAREGVETTPAPAFSDGWFEQTKHPTDWFSWGADLRARTIYDKRLTTRDSVIGDERFWQRYRARVWGEIKLMDNLSFHVRLADEFRNYCRPEGALRDTNFDQVIIDNLYVDWEEAFGLPLRVRVGRQDILGLNDWLLLDGAPLYGSGMIYFDAVRLTYQMDDATTIDAIYINTESDTSDRLPGINDRDKPVVEQDEQGAVLYVSHKLSDAMTVEGYFLYKHDVGSHHRTAAGAQPWVNQDRDVYTFGSKVLGALQDSWRYEAEIAQQVGHENGMGNICATGARGIVHYDLHDPMSNTFRLGYEYRSGDDPSTGHQEGFNILWGRWPQWSTLYNGGADTLEGDRPAYSRNLHRVQLGWSFNPVRFEREDRDLLLCLDYHLLFADQNTRGATGLATSGADSTGPRLFSKSGCFRGQLVTALCKFKVNNHIKMHVAGDFLFPGDYYTDEKNEPVVWLRYEIVFSW